MRCLGLIQASATSVESRIHWVFFLVLFSSHLFSCLHIWGCNLLMNCSWKERRGEERRGLPRAPRRCPQLKLHHALHPAVRSEKTVCLGSATRSVLFPLGQGFFTYAIAISCSDRQQLAGASAGGAGWLLQGPGCCSCRVLGAGSCLPGGCGEHPRCWEPALGAGVGRNSFLLTWNGLEQGLAGNFHSVSTLM